MELVELSCGVLLREDDACVFFLPHLMRLFRISPSAGMDLEALAREAARRFCAGSEAHTRVARAPSTAGLFPIFAPRSSSLGRARLSRLTLHISNACNLACSYCYGDGGHYHAAEQYMRPDAVREILARVYQLYGHIDVVHFFGGEPLMNLDAIDMAGDSLAAAVAEGLLDTMPAMVATTNGTWSQPEVLSTLLRWKMGLTVSWDGPRTVHDAGRPTRHGAGSYELVAASIERFRQQAIPFDIQCTYNGHHLREGVSLVDLMQFFHEHTGQRIFHIVPAYLSGSGHHDAEYIDPETLVTQYRSAARLSIANLLTERGPALQFVHRALRALATRSPSAGCPAFSSQLTIATDGSVYPCFMLTGYKSFCMGNLLEETYPGPETAPVLARYEQEMENRRKSKAWYSVLLESCVAGESIATGSLGGQSFAPIAQVIAEECVFAVAAQSPAGLQVA